MTFNLRNLFIALFFFAAPFVDALTGKLIFSGIIAEGSLFSPSQLFRFVLTTLAFYFLKSKELFIVLVVICYFLFIELISLTFHQNVNGFLIGLVYSYKIVFILLAFLVLRPIFFNQSRYSLLKYFVLSAFLYAILLILSIFLGIDEATYGKGAFGSKGFFASGNGLSLFLGVSSVLSFYFYKKEKTHASLFYYLILLIGTVLVGTKASIFFLAINILLIWFSSQKSFYILGVSIFLFLSFYLNKIVDLFSTAFDVIVFRYNNSLSVIEFLASNRDNYIKDAFETFSGSNFLPLRIIFGSGVFLSFRDYDKLTSSYDTLECDFFDIFFSYGILGLIVYLTIIFWGIYFSIKNRKYILFIAWTALCFYSLIAGHMLFNSMANIGFVILIILISTATKSANEKESNCIPSSK
jgi:hypothetical protein